VDAIQTQPTFSVGADRGNRGFGQQLPSLAPAHSRKLSVSTARVINDYANGAPAADGRNLGVDAIQEFFRPHEQLLGRVWKDFRRRRQRCYPLRDEWFARKRYEFSEQRVGARNFSIQLNPAVQAEPVRWLDWRPHYQDRTFFFADYEGIRQSRVSLRFTTVPSLFARSGLICLKATSNECQTHQLSGRAKHRCKWH